MDTKQANIRLADKLIREKGYNAFSFNDISVALGIKNASVHYHFPTKVSLGIAVLKQHKSNLERFRLQHLSANPLETLQEFIEVYSRLKAENRICIVGSLAPDILTLDTEMTSALTEFAEETVDFLSGVLNQGLNHKVFHFKQAPRTKALMIISTLLASLQLTRLTNEEDFNKIKETIITEILK